VSARTHNRVDSEHLAVKVKLAIVLGGYCQAAWWCCMSIMLLSTFSVGSMHFDFLTFETETAHTMGTITNVQAHTMHHTGRADTLRYAYDFRYELGAQTLSGKAFTTGVLEELSQVDVEYVIAAPRNARIVGTTTRYLSGITLVIGVALFFACVAWTLKRVTGLRGRSEAICSYLAVRSPDTPWGVFPKLRLNRDNQIVTWGSTSLLLAPITSLVLLSLVATFAEV
jgi:hypothetical protein